METTRTASVREEIIDPSIENARSEDCNLSILLSEDGLVFSILRNDLKKFIVLGDYVHDPAQENKQALFYFKQQLKGKFANYAIGFDTPKFTVVPLALFQQDALESYASFQFERDGDESLLYDEIPGIGLVIVYAVPNDMKALLAEHFQGIMFRHSAYFGLSYYAALYKNQPGEHIHLNVWDGTATIYVVDNGQIQLCTQFSFQSNEDLLYFVLNVYEQIGLNPERVPLKVSGNMHKKLDSWDLLEKYIRYVELEKRPVGYQYSHEFSTLPDHKYNRIFQAATCV